MGDRNIEHRLHEIEEALVRIEHRQSAAAKQAAGDHTLLERIFLLLSKPVPPKKRIPVSFSFRLNEPTPENST